MVNALISEASEYTMRTRKKRIDGAMFSCSSLGGKVGNGVGTALCGGLLSLGGYNGAATVQSASCIGMLNFIFLGLPIIYLIAMVAASFFLKVEEANRKWDLEHKAA